LSYRHLSGRLSVHHNSQWTYPNTIAKQPYQISA
jgi:hypothetical protein